MTNFKLIVFVELIALLVIVLVHIFAKSIKDDFPLEIYLFVPLIVLFSVLLTIFVIRPFADWFFKS